MWSTSRSKLEGTLLLHPRWQRANVRLDGISIGPSIIPRRTRRGSGSSEFNDTSETPQATNFLTFGGNNMGAFENVMASLQETKNTFDRTGIVLLQTNYESPARISQLAQRKLWRAVAKERRRPYVAVSATTYRPYLGYDAATKKNRRGEAPITTFEITVPKTKAMQAVVGPLLLGDHQNYAYSTVWKFYLSGRTPENTPVDRWPEIRAWLDSCAASPEARRALKLTS